MNTVYKVISVLLSYPTRELQLGVPELLEAVQSDSGIKQPVRDSIARLATDIASRDIYDAQERYVFLFDRTRSLSLHLFEHVHGESRDRGQAMVDLQLALVVPRQILCAVERAHMHTVRRVAHEHILPNSRQ